MRDGKTEAPVRAGTRSVDKVVPIAKSVALTIGWLIRLHAGRTVATQHTGNSTQAGAYCWAGVSTPGGRRGRTVAREAARAARGQHVRKAPITELYISTNTGIFA